MNAGAMSLSAALMIGLLLAVRSLALHRLPKAVFPLLWCAVLVRLFTPFYVIVPIRRAGGGAVPWNDAGWLRGLWLIGAAALAIIFLVTHLLARREYREALPVEHAFAASWLERHSCRRARVYRSDKIGTALTYGILRPVILLPAAMDWEDTDRLECVLAHELAHVKRLDVALKWALAAALCLYWFHPLVWVMYLFANRDIELACDEAALAMLGRDRAGAYARALVAMGAGGKPRPLAGQFGSRMMEERIRAIMTNKKTGICALAAVLAVACGLAAAGFLKAGRVADSATSADYLPDYSDANEGVIPHETGDSVDAAPEYVDEAGTFTGEDYTVSFVQ